MGFKVKCVPVMKQMPGCCCSCDLRVATCIVGWVCLITYAVNFFQASFVLPMLPDSEVGLPHALKIFFKTCPLFCILFLLSVGLGYSAEKFYRFHLLKYRQSSRAGLIATVIIGALGILFSALLLYGVDSEKPQFMLPSVISGLITTVIIAVAVLVISIYLLFFSSLLGGFFFLLVGVLIVVLSTFFWVVIYSYYRKLEESRYPFPATSLDNAGQEVLMHNGHTYPYSRMETR